MPSWLNNWHMQCLLNRKNAYFKMVSVLNRNSKTFSFFFLYPICRKCKQSTNLPKNKKTVKICLELLSGFAVGTILSEVILSRTNLSGSRFNHCALPICPSFHFELSKHKREAWIPFSYYTRASPSEMLSGTLHCSQNRIYVPHRDALSVHMHHIWTGVLPTWSTHQSKALVHASWTASRLYRSWCMCHGLQAKTM